MTLDNPKYCKIIKEMIDDEKQGKKTWEDFEQTFCKEERQRGRPHECGYVRTVSRMAAGDEDRHRRILEALYQKNCWAFIEDRKH